MFARPKILLGLGALAIVWGLAFVGIKWTLRDLSPTELTVARFIVADVVLLVLAMILPAARPTFPPGHRARLLILALAGVPLYHLPLNWGEQRTTAQIASLIVATAPILVAVGGVRFLGERLSSARILGLGLSFTGVVVLTLGTQNEPGVTVTGAGVAAIAIAPIVWAIYTIVAKPLMAALDPMTVTSTTLLLGSLTLLPFATPSTMRAIGDASDGTYLWLLILGAGSSVLGYVLFVWLVRQLDASETGMILYLVPVVGVLASAAILDEPLGWPVAVAAVLVVIGLRLAQQPTPSGTSPPPDVSSSP